MFKDLKSRIEQMPLIAILRGITPEEVEDISDALVDNGIIFMEVTLNSLNWEESLRRIKARHGDHIILGAGTVLSEADVDRVKAVGGQVIISPNMDMDVIKRTKEHGLVSVPGCYTPSECFTALKAGADILKIFPADTLGVPFIKAISAVLPSGTPICPTGGVTAENMHTFMDAGVYAMGMGSALYKTGRSKEDVGVQATKLVKAFERAVLG
ncbi:2-dehydro-3-deoxy-6-phosphogalactonate aldolase [Kiloniella antarctica]|uniref:2-dehydro-3-deoxy-6-phosphogalactonate aldolase n=1 Tax=Kiloniella antarctica TaxID=1550907 RepID=A0ABW5BMZ2_9PROT